jgi:hypothetical protein
MNTQTLKVDLTPEPSGSDWEEQWCFRARTLGRTGGSDPLSAYSEYSDEVCSIRHPEAVPLPQYIPWPKSTLPPQKSNLKATYLQGDGLPVVAITDALDTQGCGGSIFPTCNPEQSPTCIYDGDLSVDCDLCALVEKSLVSELSFVVYRQESRLLGHSDASQYYQVSPLITKAYCHAQNNIDDPFIKMINMLQFVEIYSHQMFFIDRFPHEEQLYYRYEFVYFDAKGEVTKYRQSNWLYAQ